MELLWSSSRELACTRIDRKGRVSREYRERVFFSAFLFLLYCDAVFGGVHFEKHSFKHFSFAGSFCQPL